MAVNRRGFLTYLGVGSIAPLFLSASVFNIARGQASDGAKQKFVFINFADGYPRGKWRPSVRSDGTLGMNDCCKPLQSVQQHCLFINGLDLRGSTGHDGFKTQWRDGNTNAPSIDTLIAQQSPYRAGYSHPHLRAGVDTNHWGHGSRVPSQRQGSSSLTYTDSPSRLFSNLFSSDIDGDSLSRENTLRKLMIDQSLEDLDELQTAADLSDSDRLNAHERELLTMKSRILGDSDSSNSVEALRWRDPTSGGNRNDRADLQVQNIALALVTSKSRLACMALGTSNDNVGIAGYAGGKSPHDTSHRLYGVDAFSATRSWYMAKIAELVVRLKRLDDPDAPGTTLLDNTVIVVTSEMSDDHSPSNLPVLLIGGQNISGTNASFINFGEAGKGRTIEHNEPIGALWSGMVDALGFSSPYSTTPISGVFV
ncbi:MAG: DUF1552 domain-containing protein [Candidatus Thiodiazotropha sp.]